MADCWKAAAAAATVFFCFLLINGAVGPDGEENSPPRYLLYTVNPGEILGNLGRHSLGNESQKMSRFQTVNAWERVGGIYGIDNMFLI